MAYGDGQVSFFNIFFSVHFKEEGSYFSVWKERHRSIEIQHCRTIMRQTDAFGSEITGKDIELDEHATLLSIICLLEGDTALLLLERLAATLTTSWKY